MVKIALVSCGTEYSGIQKEIEKAALKFGAEIILPEIDLDYINEAYEKFGFSIILMKHMRNLVSPLKVQA